MTSLDDQKKTYSKLLPKMGSMSAGRTATTNLMADARRNRGDAMATKLRKRKGRGDDIEETTTESGNRKDSP